MGLLDVERIERTPLPAGVEATLRPYQQEGFDWLAFLHRHGLGGVLADDMGLGKTLQTLALVAHAREAATSPFLVVAPTSVVPGWVREAARFVPSLRVVTLDPRTRRRSSLAQLAAGADLVVTSYALLRLDVDAVAALPWSGLVLDEAQFVKNRAAKAHQAAKAIRAPFRLAITGTPMENSLSDLWALLSLTASSMSGYRLRQLRRVCGVKACAAAELVNATDRRPRLPSASSVIRSRMARLSCAKRSASGPGCTACPASTSARTRRAKAASSARKTARSSRPSWPSTRRPARRSPAPGRATRSSSSCARASSTQ